MVDTGGSLPSRCSRYSLRSRVNLVTLDQLLPLTMLQQKQKPISFSAYTKPLSLPRPASGPRFPSDWPGAEL